MKATLLLFTILALTVVSAAPPKGQSVTDDVDAGAISDTQNNTASIVKKTNTNGTAERPADMAQALNELIVAFKRIMPCGDPSLKISVLAPLRIDKYQVNIEEELLSLKGTIKDLVMTGVNDFFIVELATNSSNNRTTFDVLYKGFQILANVNLSINADIAGYRFIQALEGLVNYQVLNVRFTGGLTIGTNSAGGMLFSDMEFYVQVGNIIFENLETKWSVAVNNFVNQQLQAVSLIYLQSNREFLNEMISAYITSSANKAFEHISSSEYIEAMGIATAMYDAIDCSP